MNSNRNPFFVRLGHFFKEARLSCNLSQKEVADALGLTSAQMISNIERGISTYPDKYYPMLVKLMKINKNDLLSAHLVAEEERIEKLLSLARKKKRTS